MRHLVYSVVLLLCLLKTKAQETFQDSIAGFEYSHFHEKIATIENGANREKYLNTIYRNYLKRKYNLFYPINEVVSKPISGSCNNLDFENGSTSGWAITGDYQLMSGTATDPYGGFPVVGPGGNFSLRLNDANVNCSGPNKKVNFKASASNYISITPTNTLVKVNFAGATLAFPHPTSAAAFIRVEFYDINNILIPTPTYSVLYASPPNTIVATNPTNSYNSSLLGPQICSTAGSYSVYCFPWQTQMFNLSSFAGQTVKIKLTADWCLYDYDWAYAYFDVCCDSTCNVYSSVSTTNLCYNKAYQTTICSSYPSNTNFQWSSTATNTTSCETVNTVGSYTLTSNPLGNPTFTVNEIFNFYKTPAITFTLPINIACINSSSGIPLFASPPGGTFSGPGVTSSSFDPWLVSAGTYTIVYNYIDPATGCSAVATQTVSVVTCTGLDPMRKNIELIIAPNPFNSQFAILYNGLNESTEFVLFNTLGQEILRKKLLEPRNVIETDELPPGLYIYSLISQNKQVKQGKLVKE